ncbi:target of Nesh-SH3 isoform X3 [Sinocyclocheilus anshuiensis]|uniref:target of Nesh-SH3 isoform X3 n=1 Tax=Sinocyclocheilus anshuiensis TaxID=1608454 RepID=UPI0007B97764|nr:PREDICTED: target of Nesh-SH3 isoform X3 [Sinocyclocheilus anshuiensis]
MSSVLFSLRKKDNMRAFLLLFLSEILLLRLTSATTMKVQRQNMRVRVSAVGDTIVLKFIRPHVDTRLEGYILGYGSSMFSKQFIQLPEDGQPYETEIDAEPKYLIAVQSKIPEEPKKKCAGKVDLDKPLNVVIGSVTESSVLLSWGTLLTSPFMDTVLEDCFDEGQFTVRYREKEPSNTWNYQTCPSTSTVIDNLKPDALYEFVVRADTNTNSGVWSAPVIHNTADQIIEPFKELNQAKPKKPVLASQQSFLPPVPVLNNINQTRAAPLLKYPSLPKPSKTSVSSTGGENPTTVPDNPPTSTEALPSSHTSIILPTLTTTSTVRPRNPTSHPSTTQADLLTEQHTSITPQQPTKSQPQPSRTQQQTSTTQQPSTTIQQYTSKMQISVKDQPNTAKQLLNKAPQQFSETSSPNPPTTKPPIQQTQQRTTSTVQEHPHPSKKQDSLHTRKIQPSTRLHRLSTTQHSRGRGIFRNSSSVSHLLARNATQRLRPHGRVPDRVHHTRFFRPPSGYHNSTGNKKTGIKVPHGDKHQGRLGSKFPKGTRVQLATKLNQVSETKEKENIIDLKQMDPVPDLKPLAPPTTERPAKQRPSSTTTPHSVFEGSRFDTSDNSSVFSSHPLSEVDATGKKRFIAPHVIYRTDKRPEEPCSVTHSLNFFPDEEIGYLNVTGPPKTPPSNLTVVTVEGCPSFIILDWDKTDNETTEYEVVSSTKGLHGEEVSVQTTNQTHTAVENLKPESSYEFKVTPKNELGSGPASEPVTFSTESADPRVSEIQTGKNAIWSSFPFKSDSYSECNGQQFIKRTWYRKFVGIQLCNSLRYKIYLSDSLKGKFYSIGDQTGYGEDHCQFVDSFLDGRTGDLLPPDQLPPRKGFYRAMRQEPVKFGDIGGNSMINYVAWYECGIPIPGKW